MCGQVFERVKCKVSVGIDWGKMYLYTTSRLKLQYVLMNNWLPRRSERTFHPERHHDDFLPVSIRLVCLHIRVLMRVAVCAVVHNTLLSRVIWQDLPHLANSDSHHCNRLWHRASFSAMPVPWIISIPEHESKASRVYHKLQLIDCPYGGVEHWFST